MKGREWFCYGLKVCWVVLKCRVKVNECGIAGFVLIPEFGYQILLYGWKSGQRSQLFVEEFID